MIFVTVGTHEQQFNRLVRYMDELAETIEEKVIIQIGFSTYEPKNCIWKRIFSYEEMDENIGKARVVITHGGPSSFIAPLRIGKIPIVVPRREEFDEHVNDHQFNFCKEVAKRKRNIIMVEDIKKLAETIKKYEEIVSKMNSSMESNNEKFCESFGELVNGMFLNY